ncbi:MAG: xanthine dehydrogenase family protein molybdopterin-binding subunit [Gammaproteobacteria bacterium]|nr:xanthine dehydrogenase family protein molybdopterin-binding subunit [Gammaproteobacteria bacterium]
MSALSRRDFLRVVSLAGGGIALGIGLGGCAGEPAPWPNARSGVFQPNAFLQLGSDGTLTLAIHKAEMGQGVMTGLATLVAEELAIDPRTLRFEFALPHPDYRGDDAVMVTGGSASIASSFDTLRQAGAVLRELLTQAAANAWQAKPGDCVAEDGMIRLRDGSRALGYGALAEAAARLPVPASVALKERADWRLIGRYDARVDAAAKVDGSAQFSIDVQLPGMLVAVLLRCPHFGGSLRRFDAEAAKAVPGVRHVLTVDGAIAVLADGYWQARRAADLVLPEWDKGPHAALDSAVLVTRQQQLLDQESGKIVREQGEQPAGNATKVVEAEYRVPYLAHATMEPMNAVARVGAASAEIWAGNQAPDVLQGLVARALEVPTANVIVHSTYLGGGFGRRVAMDFAVEAALVARAVGAPVKLVWSREDDIRHDLYRPAALSRLRAEIDVSGTLVSWQHRIVAPSIMALAMPAMGLAMLPQWVPNGVMRPVGMMIRGSDGTSVEGAKELPYEIPHLSVEYLHHDPGVPIGFWRSVGHSQNAFFVESFVDEVAQAMGEDPCAFRLDRLPAGSRQAAVLRRAADEAGWGKAPEGRFQGLAVHESFDTVVAEVVEISVASGKPRVHRVVCAVDCGTVVNPDVVRMQLESAVVFALSAALYGEITLRDGAVEQGNFDDYPVLRMSECPQIEVHMLASDAPPSGIGEPGTPPLAPALANAIFAATGQRLRSLPLRLA